MSNTLKLLVIGLVVAVIAGSAYAFAAQNTVANPGAAGYKANVVPGYTITNVVYDLNASDPTKLDKVIFDIDPTSGSAEAVTVKISVTSTQDFTTSTCVISGTAPDTLATCTFTTPVDLVNVVALDIVASSSTNP